MTIDELHDYCRYLSDENHMHGAPDTWNKGYESALSLVISKCHKGSTDEDRKTVADWREKHRKDTKQAGLTPPTRTVCTFPASNPTMPEKCTN